MLSGVKSRLKCFALCIIFIKQSYNIRQEIRPKFWHLAKSMEFFERVERINIDLHKLKNDEIDDLLLREFVINEKRDIKKLILENKYRYKLNKFVCKLNMVKLNIIN